MNSLLKSIAMCCCLLMPAAVLASTATITLVNRTNLYQFLDNSPQGHKWCKAPFMLPVKVSSCYGSHITLKPNATLQLKARIKKDNATEICFFPGGASQSFQPIPQGPVFIIMLGSTISSYAPIAIASNEPGYNIASSGDVPECPQFKPLKK